jgi:very-short-patch-repair endonuclease
MPIEIIVIAIIALLYFLIYVLPKLDNEKKSPGQYYLIPSIFTNAERKFYYVLAPLLKQYGYIAFPKVRLADIIETKSTDLSTYWKEFNKIKSKHIDFLICEDITFRPEFIVELDDPTHNKKDRISRDEFVDRSLNMAGLKVYRIKVSDIYDPEKLKQQLQLQNQKKRTLDN